MKNILHIVAAYGSVDYELTDDDICIVKVRNQEVKFISIEQAIKNFSNVSWVKGCGGIMHAYIFNTETKNLEYLKL